jgi:hypothetical protein
MFRWNRAVLGALVLTLGILAVSRAHRQIPAPPRLAQSKHIAPIFNPPTPSRASRNSALALYSEPAYGVSFRYPRNYFLSEAPDSDERSIVETQQKLLEQQPGAILLATVKIPSDAYPNTTFQSGTLQLVVNPAARLEACQSFASPIDEDYASGSSTMEGATFRWRQTGSFADGTARVNRDYAGFANGMCYEISLEVVTDENPDADQNLKEADDAKIMSKLDKIVTSLKIQPNAPKRLPNSN